MLGIHRVLGRGDSLFLELVPERQSSGRWIFRTKELASALSLPHISAQTQKVALDLNWLPNLLAPSPTPLCSRMTIQVCLCPSMAGPFPRRPEETPFHTMPPNQRFCKASVLVEIVSSLI